MHCDAVSQTSSLVSNERQLVLQLLLTTLSGEEHQVIIDLQEFDRLDEFETAVLEQLPTIGGSSTFGCEFTFFRSTRYRSNPAEPYLGHPQGLQPLSPSRPSMPLPGRTQWASKEER